jgi:hypothetical protein
MKLRQIASHNFRVLAVLDPVAGDSVLSILNDANRHHELLFTQIMASLGQHTPTYGPPFTEGRRGVANAKWLYGGLAEFVAQNEETSRRRRREHPEGDRNLGLRVFFFFYGSDIICTNVCYKVAPTPAGAISAALRIRDEYLAARAAGDEIPIQEED